MGGINCSNVCSDTPRTPLEELSINPTQKDKSISKDNSKDRINTEEEQNDTFEIISLHNADLYQNDYRKNIMINYSKGDSIEKIEDITNIPCDNNIKPLNNNCLKKTSKGNEYKEKRKNDKESDNNFNKNNYNTLSGDMIDNNLNKIIGNNLLNNQCERNLNLIPPNGIINSNFLNNNNTIPKQGSKFTEEQEMINSNLGCPLPTRIFNQTNSNRNNQIRIENELVTTMNQFNDTYGASSGTIINYTLSNQSGTAGQISGRGYYTLCRNPNNNLNNIEIQENNNNKPNTVINVANTRLKQFTGKDSCDIYSGQSQSISHNTVANEGINSKDNRINNFFGIEKKWKSDKFLKGYYSNISNTPNINYSKENNSINDALYNIKSFPFHCSTTPNKFRSSVPMFMKQGEPSKPPTVTDSDLKDLSEEKIDKVSIIKKNENIIAISNNKKDKAPLTEEKQEKKSNALDEIEDKCQDKKVNINLLSSNIKNNEENTNLKFLTLNTNVSNTISTNIYNNTLTLNNNLEKDINSEIIENNLKCEFGKGKEDSKKKDYHPIIKTLNKHRKSQNKISYHTGNLIHPELINIYSNQYPQASNLNDNSSQRNRCLTENDTNTIMSVKIKSNAKYGSESASCIVNKSNSKSMCFNNNGLHYHINSKANNYSNNLPNYHYSDMKLTSSIKSKNRHVDWKDLVITDIISEKKLLELNKNDLLLQGYFYKVNTFTDKEKELISAPLTFALLYTKEIKFYNSKENYLYSQNPIQIVPLSHISRCEMVNIHETPLKGMKGLKEFNFMIEIYKGYIYGEEERENKKNIYNKKNNVEESLGITKKRKKFNKIKLIEPLKKDNKIKESKNINDLVDSLPNIITFSCENEDICNQWICVINYLISKYEMY